MKTRYFLVHNWASFPPFHTMNTQLTGLEGRLLWWHIDMPYVKLMPRGRVMKMKEMMGGEVCGAKHLQIMNQTYSKGDRLEEPKGQYRNVIWWKVERY
ncbi:hypothetical protein CEXT_801801 [Caerostris extrusa]|uniref:Uncharacterized protein n=1 Tax=Caerostris extrusa TaxID=172846 RepID=A0AAV4R6A6_CAEEX|nr:hypothetical protein CEXT_801801 [Caerostris extrusa]